LICAATAIIIFARKHKIPLVHLADAIAPPLMIAYAVGRIGCQVAGDGDWGIVNAAPNPYGWLPDWMWSFTYPHNVNEAGVPIEGCVGRFCNQLPQPVYPTPFYETIMGLILFALLWSLRKKLRPYGALFAFYLIVNGIERFLIEQIRVNNRLDFFGLQPTQAEVIAVGLVLVGIALWVVLAQRQKKKSAA
jgi:prolipoprotein diacylglyceryltransferase